MPDREPDIFISYRGSDDRWAPDVVYQSLATTFGADAVFKAGYGLRAGDVFPEVLEAMASSCKIMLVCIGPRWLAAENARRLEQKEDWVRREIELALQAENHVIPLLLGGRDEVVVPAPEELPEDIAPLVWRQAFRLEPGGRLRMTLPVLAERLIELVPSLATRRADAGLNVKQKAQRVTGTLIGVRTDSALPDPVEVNQDIGTVGKTGTAVGVDLRQRY